MSDDSDPQLFLDDLPVQVYRSPRRSLALQVKQAQVIVRCPLGTPDRDIHAWLQGRRGWLNKHLSRQRRQQAARPRLEEGAQWLFLDESLHLSLRQASRWSINRDITQLCIAGPDLSHEKLRDRLGRWFRAEAESYMTPRTLKWARDLGMHRKLRDVRYRQTRSKWGHCSQRGTIQYNWLVMQAPALVIDYLILHEVCHLQHAHHGRAFWQLVDQHTEHRRFAQHWLREHGNSLAFAWEH